MIKTCVECGKEFDLTDEGQADDWYWGHDCEEADDVHS